MFRHEKEVYRRSEGRSTVSLTDETDFIVETVRDKDEL